MIAPCGYLDAYTNNHAGLNQLQFPELVFKWGLTELDPEVLPTLTKWIAYSNVKINHDDQNQLPQRVH